MINIPEFKKPSVLINKHKKKLENEKKQSNKSNVQKSDSKPPQSFNGINPNNFLINDDEGKVTIGESEITIERIDKKNNKAEVVKCPILVNVEKQEVIVKNSQCTWEEYSLKDKDKIIDDEKDQDEDQDEDQDK